MKTVSKKLFSLLLAVILLVSAIPFQTFAASTYTVKIKYLINGAESSTQTVKSYKVTANKKIDLTKSGKYNSFDKSSFASSISSYSFKTYKDQNGEISAPSNYKVNGNKSVTINVKLNPKDGVVGKIVYDANKGKWDSGKSTHTQKYKAGEIISKPANPTRSGYTFKGWYNGDKVFKAQFGTPWLKNKETIKLTAKWERKSASVTVYAVKGSSLKKVAVYEDCFPSSKISAVLEKRGASADVKKVIPDGYKWNGKYYSNDKCKDDAELSKSETVKNANRSVYVKFTAKKYTIKLDPAGGSVDPKKKENVEYGSTVSLPIPTKRNKVFLGWKYEPSGDIFEPENGKVKMEFDFYPPQKSTTVTLKALWSDQATVLLHVYTNGNTDKCQFVLDVTGKVVGSKLSMSEDVKAVLKKRLTSNGNGELKFMGLFDAKSWRTFVATDKDTSSSAITVPDDESTDLYIMVKNAATLNVSSGSSSSSSSSSNWDSSNPKTGDTAMIGTAFAIMAASGVALAYVLIQRKKRAN